MINIKAKKEKDGIVTHLKSEYGNVFSRDIIIESMKEGYEYYTFSKGRGNNKIHLIESRDGVFLSTFKTEISTVQKISSDRIDDLPLF